MNIWDEPDKISKEENLNKVFYIKDIYGEEEELNEGLLMEMANTVGKNVKIDDLPFSFYFSRKTVCRHSIRLKVFWDRNRINDDKCGYIELHGDYLYSQCPKQKYKPDSQDIKGLRYFAKRYKVLFAAAWECVLGEDALQDYFRGLIDFQELLKSFYVDKIGKNKYEALNYSTDLKMLEKLVRQYNIYNMND